MFSLLFLKESLYNCSAFWFLCYFYYCIYVILLSHSLKVISMDKKYIPWRILPSIALLSLCMWGCCRSACFYHVACFRHWHVCQIVVLTEVWWQSVSAWSWSLRSSRLKLSKWFPSAQHESSFTRWLILRQNIFSLIWQIVYGYISPSTRRECGWLHKSSGARWVPNFRLWICVMA